MFTSIFSTPECQAWCMHADYEEYLNIHKASGCTADPVDEQFYKEICTSFESFMQRDIENGTF